MSVVGLDVGTSRIKAVRFDGDGHAVDTEARPAEVVRGAGGAREQDMAAVWRSVHEVLAAVVGRSDDTVDLVAATAQGDGTWLVDERGEPVGPAMLWNDGRAGPVVAGWVADGTDEKAFRVSGCAAAPGLPSAQLRWLAEHDPRRLERAARVLTCGGWVHSRLTGRCVLDRTELADPFGDARTGELATDLVDLFGAPMRLLPDVVHGRGRVAPVRRDVAASLGLAPDVPVVLAPYDVPAGALGLGVVRPGATFAVLGTTFCVGAVADDPHLDRDPTGFTLPGERPGTWLLTHATMAGTEVLDWLAAVLGLDDAAAVVRLAGDAAHPTPPVVAPYLSPAGERSPLLDPDVRGTVHGLDLTHRPADLAYAAVDGLVLTVADCLDSMGDVRPTELAVCGGAARSGLVRQLLADTLGVPVTATDTEEVGARGAVVAGLVATGRGDLDDVLGRVDHTAHRTEPDPARYDAQRDRLSAVRKVRDALR